MKQKMLMLMLMATSLFCAAQEQIQFNVLKASQTDVPQTVIDALDVKLKQIMTRNSAASANDYNVFAIEPTLTFDDVKTSEGLVQNVSLATGELTLIAKNSVDNMMYYSAVIPLKSDVVGSKDKALVKMVSNIKLTDPAFTRFIRNARKKIDDYYAENCGTILQKSQTLYAQGRVDEARSYLTAISEATSCFDQASKLLEEMGAEEKPTTAPDVISIEPVAQPVEPVEPAETTPAPQPEPKVEATPEPEVKPEVKPEEKPKETVTKPKEKKLDPEISYSNDQIRVKVIECVGETSEKAVKVTLEITNKTEKVMTSVYPHIKTAIDNQGNTFSNFKGADGCSLPSNVAVRKTMSVRNVSDKVPSFSYISFRIEYTDVEVRNLPITWK